MVGTMYICPIIFKEGTLMKILYIFIYIEKSNIVINTSENMHKTVQKYPYFFTFSICNKLGRGLVK